jgi:hypothetical protein
LDWTEVGKSAAPAFVGALSAILAAVATNVFAERRHKRELALKNRELEQRSLESMIPTRLAAYRSVFLALQKSKSTSRLSPVECDDLSAHLLWVDQAFAKRVVDALAQARVGQTEQEGETTRTISQLQADIQRLVGAEELNGLFDPRRRNDIWRSTP